MIYNYCKTMHRFKNILYKCKYTFMCSKVEPFTDILSYSRYFIDTAWYGGYDAILVYRYYGICYKIYRYICGYQWFIFLFKLPEMKQSPQTRSKHTICLAK